MQKTVRTENSTMIGLRIAYFGGDGFSVRCLTRAMAAIRAIGSIDVVTRSLKPSGRGLRIKDVPLAEFAVRHGIKVLRADTNSEINEIATLHDYDLAVTVSYGNLIPQTFLERVRYGGINVHPSLLPRYSGSSPIQYTLMNDDPFTGVTVQTLHPTKFDRGEILVQSDRIPIYDDDNYTTLETKLGDVGGDLLGHCLQRQLFMAKPRFVSSYDFSTAYKINKHRSQIKWTMTSRQIKRLADALGPVYAFIQTTSGPKRVVFHDIGVDRKAVDGDVGSFALDDDAVVVKTIDGAITATHLTFECCPRENAPTFIKRLRKRTKSQTCIFI